MNTVYVGDSVYKREGKAVYKYSFSNGKRYKREYEVWELYMLVASNSIDRDKLQELLDLFNLI